MKRWIKPHQGHYVEITPHDNVTISFTESRALLERIGIPGEILPTPGYSPDSVLLLLDDSSAFTSDLTQPQFIGPEDAAVVEASWRLLRGVYPGHGPVRPLDLESAV